MIASMMHSADSLGLTSLAQRRIELKYTVDARLASEVQQWAREHLEADEHCSPQSLDSYEVSTLYFDSPALDIYHRTPQSDISKRRIRRYGAESTLWLEVKSKKQNVVKKRRSAIAAEQLQPLAVATQESRLKSDGEEWDWFAQLLIEKQLQPMVLVHYRRFARAKCADGESLRLTIDTQMQASTCREWNVHHRGASPAYDLGDTQILELKFNNNMPFLFKQLLQAFPILSANFSKYRTAVGKCEIASAPLLGRNTDA